MATTWTKHFTQLEAALREKDEALTAAAKTILLLKNGENVVLKPSPGEWEAMEQQRDSARAWASRWKAFAKWSGGRITFLEQERQRSDVEKQNADLIRRLNGAEAERDRYKAAADAACKLYKALLISVYGYGRFEHYCKEHADLRQVLIEAGYNLDSSEKEAT